MPNVPARRERDLAPEKLPARRARDLTAPLLTAVLLGVLLFSVRDILSPPLVFPLVLFGLWPLRRRAGMRGALIAATLLTLFWVLHHYGALLGPFFAALIIAYLLAPLVDYVERLHTRRALAIAVVAIPFFGLLVLLAVLTLPQVWSQAVQLVNSLPRLGASLIDRLDWARDRLSTLSFLTPEQRSWLQNLDASEVGAILAQNGDEILRRLGTWALALVRRLGTIFGILGYLVITPVVAFYLLLDWKYILKGAEQLIPPARRPKVFSFLQEYDKAVGKFVRGQLLEATFVGVLTTTGLSLLGVPNALLLGVTSGVFNLVPYIGLFVSIIPALLVALTMPSPLDGLWRVGVVYFIVQLIDGSVTGPRIVGNSVGIHPVWIMLALGFGAALLGFVGLILAVPVAVLVKMLGRHALLRYRRSAFYRTGEVEEPAAS